MPQAKYEKLLLDRTHSKRLWENEPAEDITLRDLDRAQIARVVDAARTAGRLSSMERGGISNILDRLGVRKNGVILNAAIVLFGKKFLPDYPQCELRLARFRGLDKTEFMDQKMLRGPALVYRNFKGPFCGNGRGGWGRERPMAVGVTVSICFWVSGRRFPPLFRFHEPSISAENQAPSAVFRAYRHTTALPIVALFYHAGV